MYDGGIYQVFGFRFVKHVVRFAARMGVTQLLAQWAAMAVAETGGRPAKRTRLAPVSSLMQIQGK